MRIVYAADLHGDIARYRALSALAGAQGADVVILGGDLCAYSRYADPQIAFVETALRDWLRNVPAWVYAIPGNVDWPAAVAAMQRLADVGVWRILSLDPTELAAGWYAIGYSHVPPTPFHRRDAERRDLARDRFASAKPIYLSDAEGRSTLAPADALDRRPSIEEELATVGCLPECSIVVAHTPPFGGSLDVTRAQRHAGSRALQAWIARRQPCVALHGHIHEAPAITFRWAEWIGRSLCVNPGHGEPLHAVVLDTDALPHGVWHTVYGALVPDGDLSHQRWGGHPPA
ncbi:MAG: metallophosphoesterase family protein [Anaerolineae bacterium]